MTDVTKPPANVGLPRFERPVINEEPRDRGALARPATVIAIEKIMQHSGLKSFFCDVRVRFVALNRDVLIVVLSASDGKKQLAHTM